MSKHFLLTLHSKTLHSAFMNMKLSLLLFCNKVDVSYQTFYEYSSQWWTKFQI